MKMTTNKCFHLRFRRSILYGLIVSFENSIEVVVTVKKCVTPIVPQKESYYPKTEPNNIKKRPFILTLI